MPTYDDASLTYDSSSTQYDGASTETVVQPPAASATASAPAPGVVLLVEAAVASATASALAPSLKAKGGAIAYRVLIDLDGRGRYDYDAGGDLVSASTERGRLDRTGMADVGMATIVLKSRDARYYLDRGAALPGLARGRRIKLQVLADGKLEDLFSGRIDDIVPVLSATGDEYLAELRCQDRMADIADRDIDVGVQKRKRTDRLIREVLRAARWDGPKKLSDLTGTVHWAWFEDTTALSAIAQLCEADGGTFFVDRHGRAVFHPRRFRQVRRQRTELVVDEFVVDYAELPHDIYTEVKVQVNGVRLRKLQEVWADTDEFKLRPGKSRSFWIDFADPVLKLRDPDPDRKDYAGTAPKDRDTDRTSLLKVTVESRSPTRAKLKVKNTDASLVVRVTKLRLRGRPLRPHGLKSVRLRANELDVIGGHKVGQTKTNSGNKIKDAPEGQYRFRRRDIDNLWVQTPAYARGLARYTRDQMSKVQPRIRLVLRPRTDTFERDVKNLAQLEVSDRVEYTNTVIGLNSRGYWIDHVRHEIRPGGAWRTTVEAAPAFTIDNNRKVGTGKVGSTKVS